MSSFVIVPLLFWDCPLRTISSTTTTVGTVYNALNSPRDDYFDIEISGQVNNEGNAAFSIPTSISDAPSALWFRFDDSVLGYTSPDSYLYQLWVGADSGTIAQKTLVTVYGDGKVDSDDTFLDDSSAHSSKVDDYANVVSIYDDQYTQAYWRVLFTSTGTPPAAAKIHEFMFGHAVTLPDGFIRKERTLDLIHYGGRVGTRRSGNPVWSGVYSHRPRQSFELQMTSLRSSERDKWRDIFRYGRGTLPLLFVEDSEDISTWIKCKMTGRTETEMSGEYDVTIDLEQI